MMKRILIVICILFLVSCSGQERETATKNIYESNPIDSFYDSINWFSLTDFRTIEEYRAATWQIELENAFGKLTELSSPYIADAQEMMKKAKSDYIIYVANEADINAKAWCSNLFKKEVLDGTEEPVIDGAVTEMYSTARSDIYRKKYAETLKILAENGTGIEFKFNRGQAEEIFIEFEKEPRKINRAADYENEKIEKLFKYNAIDRKYIKEYFNGEDNAVMENSAKHAEAWETEMNKAYGIVYDSVYNFHGEKESVLESQKYFISFVSTEAYIYSKIRNIGMLDDKWEEENLEPDDLADSIRENYYKAISFKERTKEIYIFLDSIGIGPVL